MDECVWTYLNKALSWNILCTCILSHKVPCIWPHAHIHLERKWGVIYQSIKSALVTIMKVQVIFTFLWVAWLSLTIKLSVRTSPFPKLLIFYLHIVNIYLKLLNISVLWFVCWVCWFIYLSCSEVNQLSKGITDSILLLGFVLML